MLVVATPMAQSIVSCDQVISNVSPCIMYLRSIGPLTPTCCNGIKVLNSAAVTTPNRQQICNCLKNAAKSASGINPTLAAGLPGKCGVNNPFNISPSTNCALYV
ncbi:hypothetical protein LWI29_019643 [Acer saccharum]|uniref:Non-specific lipid-transfer protein n=1 Tax=Acer saccharum TaxID=4024 RepID=A0AA39VMU8_ACESA|nr:hypothetical protein LWI29_019643 [Acer saccharum]